MWLVHLGQWRWGLPSDRTRAPGRYSLGCPGARQAGAADRRSSTAFLAPAALALSAWLDLHPAGAGPPVAAPAILPAPDEEPGIGVAAILHRLAILGQPGHGLVGTERAFQALGQCSAGNRFFGRARRELGDHLPVCPLGGAMLLHGPPTWSGLVRHGEEEREPRTPSSGSGTSADWPEAGLGLGPALDDHRR